MKRGLVVCLALTVLGCGEREGSGERTSGTCSRTADAMSEVTVASVTRGLDAIVRAYESESQGSTPCDMDGVGLIRRLPNPDDQRACAEYFLSRLLSIRIAHLPYPRQASVIGFVLGDLESLRGVGREGTSYWHDWYDVTLKALDWQKAQILRVRPKHRLPEQGLCNLEQEEELRGWRTVYFGGMRNYEAGLRTLEGLFPYRRRQMGDEVWQEIRDKIETWLGRPLRTAAQIHRDHKEKRNVVFDVTDDYRGAP